MGREDRTNNTCESEPPSFPPNGTIATSDREQADRNTERVQRKRRITHVQPNKSTAAVVRGEGTGQQTDDAKTVTRMLSDEEVADCRPLFENSSKLRKLCELMEPADASSHRKAGTKPGAAVTHRRSSKADTKPQE